MLRVENACVYGPGAKVYLAEQVDAILAEKDKEIESLKASHYAESVDAGMRERRLRRALWLCRAGMARMQYLVYRKMNMAKDMLYWYDKKKKFRAKAEEYK